ncbi:hypothetical protein GQ54DRAFT_246983, partial [Martensiomyces pterosporus]
ALRQALKMLAPVRDDFRLADYSTSFNWAHDHLPHRPPGDLSWYAVVFRSRRKADCNNVDLFEADRLAYTEAFANTNGALLVYWYTGLDKDSNCLATCVWASRGHAVSVSSLPAHKDAARLSAGSYVHYKIDRQRIEWLPEESKLQV